MRQDAKLMVGMWAGRSGWPWRSELGSQWDFVGELVGGWGVGKCILSCHVCYLPNNNFFFSSHTMGFACRESQAMPIYFFFPFFSFALPHSFTLPQYSSASEGVLAIYRRSAVTLGEREPTCDFMPVCLRLPHISGPSLLEVLQRLPRVRDRTTIRRCLRRPDRLIVSAPHIQHTTHNSFQKRNSTLPEENHVLCVQAHDSSRPPLHIATGE